MPTRDKERGTWIGKFKFQGAVYRKRGFETIQLARDWETDERRKLKYPYLNPPPPKEEPPSVSFLSLATDYLKDCKTKMQANTVRSKDDYFSQFLVKLGEKKFPAENVTKMQIAEHLAVIQAEGGNKLANRHLKELKALYRWGIKSDLICKNPTANIEPYSEDPYIKYVPPAEDINAVILAAEQDEGDLLLILYHTAARISEIRKLTWEDVNFEHRWVRLWTRKRKRGQLEPDILPMTDKLFAVLHDRWEKRDKKASHTFHKGGEMLSRDSDFIRHMMDRLCKRANVKAFGFHAIRHHVASIIQDSGKATLKEIQLFLRHKRQTTTENYLHQLDPRLSRVVSVLDEDGKEKKSGTQDGIS